jgi:phosphonoacetaldehyde hydrolase
VKGVGAVIFDWAGTAVDHGCFGPVAAFLQAFARHGVDVTPAEARGPMGLHKRDHIRALLRLPGVAERWRKAHGREPGESAVEAVYGAFVPLQLDVIGDYCEPVPALLECVAALRARGLRIGATTGYFAAAAESLYAGARARGYAPDCCVCAEDVPAGRPAPWMIFRVLEGLGVYPPSRAVKVGDTTPDIEEGRNAGVWSVGVTRTGSMVGCTAEEFAALAEAERRSRLAAARYELLEAGTHDVIESLDELPELVARIDARLREGAKP